MRRKACLKNLCDKQGTCGTCTYPLTTLQLPSAFSWCFLLCSVSLLIIYSHLPIVSIGYPEFFQKIFWYAQLFRILPWNHTFIVRFFFPKALYERIIALFGVERRACAIDLSEMETLSEEKGCFASQSSIICTRGAAFPLEKAPAFSRGKVPACSRPLRGRLRRA